MIPVHYAQGIFYAPYTKVDSSLSGGPLGETGYHVSNIALSEADKIVEFLYSDFISDDVVIALCAKPGPIRGLVGWVTFGLWRSQNYQYICCHIKINGAVLA